MMGIIAITARASLQLIMNRSTLAPIMIKTDDIRDGIASEINVFTASTSDVRFVRSFAGEHTPVRYFAIR